MIAGLDVGLGFFISGLVLIVLAWILLRLSPRNILAAPRVLPDFAPLEPTTSNDAVLIVQAGGRVEYLNALAREWFNLRKVGSQPSTTYSSLQIAGLHIAESWFRVRGTGFSNCEICNPAICNACVSPCEAFLKRAQKKGAVPAIMLSDPFDPSQSTRPLGNARQLTQRQRVASLTSPGAHDTLAVADVAAVFSRP